MGDRADKRLFELGLAKSRKHAQDLIDAGRVYLRANRTKIKKSSQIVEAATADAFVVTTAEEFVSRGGTKLKGALLRTGLAIENKTVLDIGISTGGFTDCLLVHGARGVIGVDVGHGQLDPRLTRDPRVHLIEGVNARDLSSCNLLGLTGQNKFDLIVCDLSFISQVLVLPEAIQYLSESGNWLSLVKPQFEVGKEALGKSGIVSDPELHLKVELKMRQLCSDNGLRVLDYFPSPIEGGDGNKEFFLWACFKST